MSIIKKISIKNAIQQAQDNMGIDHNRDIPLFTSWAVEADRKIGSYYSYKKKVVVLDVCDCRAELPCEAVAVLALMLGDHGCNCGTKFHGLFSFINTNLSAHNAGSGWIVIDDSGLGHGGFRCGANYEIQNNQLVFSNNLDGKKVTVQILALEVDAQGFPLINQNHVDAVAQYIEYKNALRTRWNSTENKITESGIMHMEKEWGRKCRWARGDDAEPSESERREITSMINDPISGIGIALFRFNDLYYGWGGRY